MALQIHEQSELDWVSFWKKKKMLVFNAAILCVVEGRMVMAVCVGGSVNDVCMEVTGCGDGCVGVEWGVFGGVGGWVGDWVLEYLHSLYANSHNKQEYRVLNSIWPKSWIQWVLEKHSSFVATNSIPFSHPSLCNTPNDMCTWMTFCKDIL